MAVAVSSPGHDAPAIPSHDARTSAWTNHLQAQTDQQTGDTE